MRRMKRSEALWDRRGVSKGESNHATTYPRAWRGCHFTLFVIPEGNLCLFLWLLLQPQQASTNALRATVQSEASPTDFRLGAFSLNERWQFQR
jgi:hypothetical protein